MNRTKTNCIALFPSLFLGGSTFSNEPVDKCDNTQKAERDRTALFDKPMEGKNPMRDLPTEILNTNLETNSGNTPEEKSSTTKRPKISPSNLKRIQNHLKDPKKPRSNNWLILEANEDVKRKSTNMGDKTPAKHWENVIQSGFPCSTESETESIGTTTQIEELFGIKASEVSHIGANDVNKEEQIDKKQKNDEIESIYREEDNIKIDNTEAIKQIIITEHKKRKKKQKTVDITEQIDPIENQAILSESRNETPRPESNLEIIEKNQKAAIEDFSKAKNEGRIIGITFGLGRISFFILLKKISYCHSFIKKLFSMV